MDTILARDIRNAAEKSRYDAACRNILADKHVLAWLLKDTLTEYHGQSIADILPCIEPPEIGTMRLDDTNAPSRIAGMSDSDKSLYEGDIFYDIRFSALVKDVLTSLIINVEEQNDFYPGYPILKRGAYYCGRMISSQNGTVFTNQQYGKLRKVVSIWICPNPPKGQEHCIMRYAMQEEAIIGKANHPPEEYDMMSIILVNLGDPVAHKENDALRLLSVLLSTKMQPQEKKQVLADGFAIPMTQEMEEEAEIMCNLSDGIEMRGIEKGKTEMVLEMLRANQPLELIVRFSKFSKEKIAEIGKQNGIPLAE